MGCVDPEKLMGVAAYVVAERKRVIEETDRREQEYQERLERGEVSDEERKEHLRKQLFGR
jgi:uncharacterized membrane protein